MTSDSAVPGDLQKRRADLVTSLVILLYFAVIFTLAFSYPPEARLFPLVLGLPGLVLALLVCGRAMARWRRARAGPAGGGAAAAKDRRALSWPDLVAFGLGAFYLLAVAVLGFVIATALISLLVPYLLGYRKPLQVALFTAILLLSVWLIFPVMLGLSLPTGLLNLV